MKTLTALLFFFALTVSAQELALTPTGFVGTKAPDKDYVVVLTPASRQELYHNVLTYLNGQYNSPENVLTSITDEQIVINAMADGLVKDPPVAVYYQMVLRFKDGKIRIDMPHLEMDRYGNPAGKVLYLSLEKKSLMGKYGIWTKGKLRFPNAKESLETFFNTFIADITTAATNTDDW